MRNFEFKQVENGFRWESDFLALEFSNPSIQGFSEFIQLTSEKEILYYYYTVKIFKKISEWDDNDNESIIWELVSERHTHDFPMILQLKWLLEFQLNDNPMIDGQKVQYTNGSAQYRKTMATDGFGCDDFYEITKSIDSNGNDERYVVYCGSAFEHQSDLNSVGIRTPYVKKEDIEELFACVTSFIAYSLEEHNKEVALYTSCYEVKENKIYEYGITGDLVDNNIVESFYTVGERVKFFTVVDNVENEHNQAVITKIEGDSVFLSSNVVVKGSSIAFISMDVADEKLTYKEQEIAKDFINVLSQKEKEEFEQKSIEHLLEKYKMAIIDRTLMCRTEHEFNMDYHTGDRVAAVTPIVKEVIGVVKELLTK